MLDIKPVSHRQIWQLAGPMILANMSIPIVGIVDTAVVGHLDSAHYLGAVAIGTLIFNFLFWAFGFLRMGTTGLTAQAYGQNKPEDSWLTMQYSIAFAIGIALLLILLQTPLSQLAFYLMEPSPLVSQFGQDYFAIRIWSAPAILINYVILGWLIGKGATRAALILVIFVNLSNILFDILFVTVFNYAVSGVAAASVLAEYIGLSIGYVLVRQQGFRFYRSNSHSPITLATKLFNLHGNIFIRTLCLLFSFAFFTSQSAKQGDVILAANAVLLHFITFMAFFLDGFANAAEVITGQAMGAKQKQQLKQGLLYAGFWSIAIAIAFSVSYALFGQFVIGLLTSIPDVIEAASRYLRWLIVAPLIGVWSYLFDGMFIGAMRSREMRNTMLFSTFICYLPAWYLLTALGNHGLWLALLIFLTARGLSQAYYLPKILSETEC